MSYKKGLSLLYVLLVVFSILLIAIIANHLYASTIDGHFNGFFKTAFESLKLNYYKITGRWAQGLTFDYRLQTNRVISTTLNNVILVLAMYYLVKQLFIKHAIIVTAVCYFSFFYSAHNLYQVTHLLNTALSYTFGLSLIFIVFGIYIKHPKPKLTIIIVSALLLLFITGLVEHLFVILLLILGYLVFEDVIFSIKTKSRKINLHTLIYLGVTLAGSLLVVFSPGSTRRRELTSKRLETSGYSGSFDFVRYFESLNRELIDQLNISSLLFFLVILVVISMLKKNQVIFKSKLDLKFRATLLLLFSIALVITPITVGFLASNGKVGMPKAYNLTVILFLFFLSVLAFTLNVFFKIKFNKITANVLLTLPLVFYIMSYALPSNNLYMQQNQVISGQLQTSSEEILARRLYLAETNSIYQEKIIPELSLEYKSKVYAAHRYPKMNNYYSRIFNNGIPVYTDKNLPNALEFTSIFLVNNNKLKPIYNQNNIQIYYCNLFHTLVFEGNTLFSDKNFKTLTIIVDNEVLKINLDTIFNSKREFYSQNPKHTAVTLPRNSKAIEIKELQGTKFNLTDEDIKDKTTYSFNYGNLMR